MSPSSSTARSIGAQASEFRTSTSGFRYRVQASGFGFRISTSGFRGLFGNKLHVRDVSVVVHCSRDPGYFLGDLSRFSGFVFRVVQYIRVEACEVRVAGVSDIELRLQGFGKEPHPRLRCLCRRPLLDAFGFRHPRFGFRVSGIEFSGEGGMGVTRAWGQSWSFSTSAVSSSSSAPRCIRLQAFQFRVSGFGYQAWGSGVCLETTSTFAMSSSASTASSFRVVGSGFRLSS